MKIKFIKPQILGLYLSDTQDIYNNNSIKCVVNPKSVGYLPIIEYVTLNRQEEVRFVDGMNKNNEVITYNRHTSSQSLDRNAILKGRIDVSANALLATPVVICLNFTNYNVTFSTPGDHRVTFSPIESSRFEEYDGKILFFSLMVLNNPKQIRDINGYANYLETLIEKYSKEVINKNEEMIELLSYVNDNLHTVELTNKLDRLNGIKVSTLIEVDIDFLLSDQEKTLYIENKKWLITLEDIVNAPIHPESSNLLLHGDTAKEIKDNSVVCYIVDNEDLISDRYINFAGCVQRVPKIKNPALPNGLYMINKTEEKINNQLVIKLEDIDTSQFIFKSREEALEGADVSKKYKDELQQKQAELELERLKKQQEVIESKSEAEKIVHSLKTALAEQQLELTRQQHETDMLYKAKLREQELAFEQRIRELKESIDKRKLDHETHSLQNKENHDYFKYRLDRETSYVKSQYESQKYERDSTLETIKTIGGIAGLLAGGFVLYGKLAK